MSELSRRHFLHGSLAFGYLASASRAVADIPGIPDAATAAWRDLTPVLAVARTILHGFSRAASGRFSSLADALASIDPDSSIDGWIYRGWGGAVAAGRVDRCGPIQLEARQAVEGPDATCADLGARIGLAGIRQCRAGSGGGAIGAMTLAASRVRFVNDIRRWRLAVALANPTSPGSVRESLAVWQVVADRGSRWTLHAATAAHEQANTHD